MSGAVEAAGQVLDRFSPDLGQAWREDPWNRVDLAFAFARGFVQNESDDVHPTASLIIETALADREVRRAEAAVVEARGRLLSRRRE